LYSWGQYEELIYQSHVTPGKVPPEMQIQQLEQDYQKARANNQRVPPGFHAHLGYLYYQVGKLDQARQEFATEKAEFPESAVFHEPSPREAGREMIARRLLQATGCLLAAVMMGGCAAPKPYDYTNFREKRPRSILVLPPLNKSSSVEATYGYLSTVTYP